MFAHLLASSRPALRRPAMALGAATTMARVRLTSSLPRFGQAAAAEHVASDESLPNDEPAPISNLTQTTGTADRDEFWRKIPIWANVDADKFLSYDWGIHNTVENRGSKLEKFLEATLPDEVPFGKQGKETQTREELMADIMDGAAQATMSIRVTPYIISLINWEDPHKDPLFRQFMPTKSAMLPDHPKLALDSLGEEADSVTKGLVHRYPDKALFLATSVCPTYCLFCTRSYSVGANTDTVAKKSMVPSMSRWEKAFAYIRTQPELHDIVVSGGDSYYLSPDMVTHVGNSLLAMPNIRRFRFASKGLAVAPARVVDGADAWFAAVAAVAAKARSLGKSVAVHTHFNHPAEFTWITSLAAQRLLEAGVTVRNQTVLLRGINDDVATMGTLIRKLADHNITPYYVYQCDMVKSVEHLRTPLHTILHLEAHLRGTIAGFMTPQFVVDLPGGGGKRLACSFRSYDRATGLSTFAAPAITSHGKEDKIYEYYDPIHSLPAAS